MANPIAVVGANGFIGSNLARELMAQGHTVAQFIRGTRLDFRDCPVVYHVAGVTGGSAFLESDPLAMVGNNLRLALDVFDAAKRDGVRHVIAMSSTTGYPDAPWAVREDEFFRNNVAPVYTNPGETRRFIERLGRMYPFDLTFIRCAGAYGPGDDYDPATSHVIGATIRKIAERQDPLICWGDGNDARDGTYIDDLVRALIAARELKGQRSLNIGTGTTMTVNQMIAVLAEHAGYEPQVLRDLSRPKMIRSRVLDVSAAKELLDWEARIGMAEGLTRTLDWYERAR